jgi:small subunit ribosomal protein S20
MRQSTVRTARNKAQRSQLRNAVKKVRAATGEAVAEAYAEAIKVIDRAGRKNLIHRNAASRQKSRLSKLLKK